MSRTPNRHGIVTVYVYPPIPVRDMDWMAYIEGDEEGPTGRGETEADALLDLAGQLADLHFDGKGNARTREMEIALAAQINDDDADLRPRNPK